MTQSPSRRRRGGRERSGPAPPPSPEQPARVNPSRRRRRVAARPRGPSLLVFGARADGIQDSFAAGHDQRDHKHERAAERARERRRARRGGGPAGTPSALRRHDGRDRRTSTVRRRPRGAYSRAESSRRVERHGLRRQHAVVAQPRSRRDAASRGKRQASVRRGGGLDEEPRLAAARRRRRRAGDDVRAVHGPRSIPAGLGAPSLALAHVLGEPPSSAAASALVRLRGAGWAARCGGAISREQATRRRR